MRSKFKQLCFDAEDYLASGQLALAVKTYRSALAQSKDEMEKYMALAFIGAAYDDEDNQRMALSAFRECREFAEKSFGKNSIQFALTMSNEGMVYSNRGKFERAEPFLEAAIKILRSLEQKIDIRVLPNAWENTVEVFASAGECKARLGKIDEALMLMKEAFKLAKANLPSDNGRRLQASLELGTLLGCLGCTHDADKIMKEAMLGLQKSKMNPQKAFEMVQQSIANTASFLEGIESTQLVSSDKSKAKKHSNVVPIASHKNAREKINCAGYQLKIALNRVQPPVWRRVVVPADYSLSKLHTIIQQAMGWSNSHLHEFRMGRSRFGDVIQLSDGVKDERKLALADLNLSVGTKIEYEYDFGDGWVHSITIEKALTHQQLDVSDVFIAGKGACPPEDCGGPSGFMRLLESLKLGDKDKLPEWLADYDPKSLPDCFKPKSKNKAAANTGTETSQLSLF